MASIPNVAPNIAVISINPSFTGLQETILSTKNKLSCTYNQ